MKPLLGTDGGRGTERFRTCPESSTNLGKLKGIPALGVRSRSVELGRIRSQNIYIAKNTTIVHKLPFSLV